jgi:hypothetical protein
MLLIGAKPSKNGFAHQNKAKTTPDIPSWCMVMRWTPKKASLAILATHSANLLQLAGA